MNTLRVYIAAKQYGVPQTGLSLGNFSVTVYRVEYTVLPANEDTLVSGATMSREIGSGFYEYQYSGPLDLEVYDYVVVIQYLGSVVLDETYWYAYDVDDDIGTRIDILEGPSEWTYIAYETGGTTPISGVDIKVTSDISGNSVIASGVTNSSGQVVLSLWPNQTIYVWRIKAGYTFSNPDVEVI